MLNDVAKDELTLSSRITGIHKRGDILALDEPCQGFELLLRFGQGLQVEMRRNDGQLSKAPFPALHVVLLWGHNLQEVSHGRRNHHVIAFKHIIIFFEASQGAGEVGGNRGLFCNDKGLGQGVDSQR